jgi:hypothetical protein
MISLEDEYGKPVSSLEFGEVYYSSASLSFKKLLVCNDSDESIVVSPECFDADEYPVAVKIIEINSTKQFDLECVRMLLELPQMQLLVQPRSKLEVRAYLAFNFTCEDQFFYSNHKRVGGTSFFRINLSMFLRLTTTKTDSLPDIALPVGASACNSVLSVDDNDIEFDSCIVGNTYVRDIQIWNRSECLLCYRITPHGGKAAGRLPLTFTDFETGKILNLYELLTIPAFSSQRVRITLKAKVSES